MEAKYLTVLISLDSCDPKTKAVEPFPASWAFASKAAFARFYTGVFAIVQVPKSPKADIDDAGSFIDKE